jgi:TrmH RNA methyltransferase
VRRSPQPPNKARRSAGERTKAAHTTSRGPAGAGAGEHRAGERRAEEHRAEERRAGGEIVYGLRAGLALLAARPDAVLRVAHARELLHGELEPALRTLDRSISVRVLGDGELARAAGASTHEGLVIEARPRVWATPAALTERLVSHGGAAIALDRVRNPYNVGAILRTAAFFGLDGAILGAIAPHPALAPDAVRVAEGGAERIPLSRTTDIADTLSRMRARGVRVIGADGRGTASAIGFSYGRPVVLVVGHEREGISDRARAQCDAIVAITGTGAIESLNVAVAAGLIIGEIVRAAAPSPRR